MLLRGRVREAWPGALELEPDVGASFVYAPAAGDVLDESEPPATDLIELASAHLPRESPAPVDDLDTQAVGVQHCAQRDLPRAVTYGVADELADEQLGVGQQLPLDAVGAKVAQRAARDGGCAQRSCKLDVKIGRVGDHRPAPR